MRNRSNQKTQGVTIIELTLVIAVLLGLITVTLVGASAYKQGTNRATCIQNIANSQRAVRSFSNLNELVAGTEITGLQSMIYAPNGFLPLEPNCPSNGEYTFLGDLIPELGSLYLSCSIETHAPVDNSIW